MNRSMPFVQSGPYPFQNGGLPAMVSGSAAAAAAARQGMAAYQTNQPGMQYAISKAQQQQAVKDAKGLLFQMPAVRGGSAKPTPQEKAVIESATGVNSEDFIVESLPVDMPQLDMSELDMVVIEEPKKISPMTYAIGAAALVLGGLYLLRN